MTILIFLLNLAGATMLLLFAVRMVQTGIERAMGPGFKRIITRHKDSRFRTAMAGILLAVVLQSATASTLLAAGFTASGLLTLAGGLAVVLGADFGSAMVIQVLTFDLRWMIPLLLVSGGYLFLKEPSQTLRQVGRILLGIAFILLALRLIGEAMGPIRDGSFLPAIAGYLQADYVTAFLVGAAITFVMHSSVAAILMFVTFVSLGVLPVIAGVSLILGANLGSALLAIWLSRGMSNKARRVPLGNLFLRGTGAILALILINNSPILSWLSGFESGQILVSVHLTFNIVLLFISLPFVGFLERPLRALLPDPKVSDSPDPLKPISALDDKVINNPQMAIASLTREVLRMSEIVEMMTRPVMELYESGDNERIKVLQLLDKSVNSALSDIRRYAAKIPLDKMSKSQARHVRELTEYSINLEVAGDIVAKKLLHLAKIKAQKRLNFSKAGWNELQDLHERVIANMSVAFNVLLTEDIECARMLMEEKSIMANKERKSRKKHLKRLREGFEDSFESSDIHLETLRALKDLNSQIAAVAYPILYRGGQMLDTRLVENLDEAAE
ncbi:MAG: Na/Pi cotransporter family protein [Devosiaceae bacterium]|nr:Na/Pi cotransporter family protein [Devosiaceae bacterium]